CVRHPMATRQTTGGPCKARRYLTPFRAVRQIKRSLPFVCPALPVFSLGCPHFSARHSFATVVRGYWVCRLAFVGSARPGRRPPDHEPETALRSVSPARRT